MSYNNDQNEYPLPSDGKSNRRSETLLPRYFRTPANKKFLQSTLDELTLPGVAEKLNGYFGRRISKAFKPTDNYISDLSAARENYQFEPVAVIKDELDNVTFYKDYNDYINQIENFGGNARNHNVLNAQEYYAWNPNINWDLLVNFREYYWLPNGPQTVSVFGHGREVVSTVKITLEDNLDNVTYAFSNNPLVQNPSLVLYRGQTYKFDINTPGQPFTIKTKRTTNEDFNFVSGVSAQGVEQGTVTLTVDQNAPEVLYYVSGTDIVNGGLIQVKDFDENTEINVQQEILGKTQYTTQAGFALSNGMKIRFIGAVTPQEYAQGEWYVEGVGQSIKLISERALEVIGGYTEDIQVPFDSAAFDRRPFETSNGYSAAKDYIIINRASADRNAWSRNNRWFHRDVIEQSAKINNQPISVDQSARATRPIIEFDAGLKLLNFGTESKPNVNLVDTFTKDVFSTVEGAVGYYVDGVQLSEGMRVLFTAEEDLRRADRIYTVKFITHLNQRQISLVEEQDSEPVAGQTVLVTNGVQHQGTMFFYDGAQWALAQHKSTANQPPLFDLFDQYNVSLADTDRYPATTFSGCKVFSYKQGRGAADKELGFPLSYRSINNVGDIVFDFNLLSDKFTIDDELDNIQSTDTASLKKFQGLYDFVFVNGWQVSNIESVQDVLRQFVAEENQKDILIDSYSVVPDVDSLKIRVTVNNALVFNNTDFVIATENGNLIVRFNTPLTENDIVVLRTRCPICKGAPGLYELPANLEKNPLNNNIETFTLGEVNEHVGTIVTEADGFNGKFPGSSNLRDLGNVSEHGKKFLQHSGPINLSLYHLTSKTANIVKAVDFSRREYAKFKRLFLQKSLELGFDGSPKEHVDRIFNSLNKEKHGGMPFYFSDMAPIGGEKQLTFNVLAQTGQFFPLSRSFSLENPSVNAVTVYLNDLQLLFGEDYTFNQDGFCVVTASVAPGDVINIYEYETTDGSFIPPTPTKLGLFPKYHPKKFLDSTYQIPVEMIQGHDGSIVKAFNDYRDDLILELEKRIYNNIKVNYDQTIIDIHQFVPGEYRVTNIQQSDIDNCLTKDFAKWLSIIDDVDYTNIDFYQRDNSFTYNYSFMLSPNGNNLPGFWRAVYQQAYDTDRPHSHPWEMLGFTIKPNWWNLAYGPAPYTSNNLLLWTDLENGAIADPSARRTVIEKYKRPGLLTHIPVDAQGNLLSPLVSGYAKNYVNSYTRTSFAFGDQAPTETAWRRSSEYPFALMKAWILSQPSKIIGLGFDRYRTVRNAAGQLIYKDTGKRIRLEDLQFPNAAGPSVKRDDSLGNNRRVFTAGFVNFIANYLTSNVLTNYSTYKADLTRLSNQIGFKISGFTDKSKFNLILDSRTPLNQGNVFVPEENYNITLQTSSPVEIATYSGVIIEKSESGFIIRGYDASNPVFTFYQAKESDKDPLINVGGISESFAEWSIRQRYAKGSIVLFGGAYYRARESHTSSSAFDSAKFVRLPDLPLVGGRLAFFRRAFDKTQLQTVAYGTLIRTVQGVVDFLLGYSQYLTDQGFDFNNFNDELAAVENWRLSAKEFMFWTTQNWESGSLLTVSPGARKIVFRRDTVVVDNLFDGFYDYSLIKADGTTIAREFVSISRNDSNEFTVELKNTADGLYAVKLPLVRKEHAVLLDNQTAFKDVIYDPEPGYRQERIKVLGYRSANWKGGLSIPGFIYDEAIATEWQSWKDYSIGEIVKYKEFYYTAARKVSGAAQFDNKNWNRLAKKPESGLLTNLEYKTNQFADFYDLDTDNFDITQQEYAQHLIGYQKREYLANIINDDVSQYKFYQGFIQDKGTKNALSKLFDALGNTDEAGLEFYEEWAVRVGQYGCSDGFAEVEFLLDESQMRTDPQPILLVDSIPDNSTDLIYRQLPADVYLKPQDYAHTPFPVKYSNDTPIKTAGFVREEDVQWTLVNKQDILEFDVAAIATGEYVWTTFDNQSWNVYKHVDLGEIVRITPQGSETEIELSQNVQLAAGDVVGILGVEEISGFFSVVSAINNLLVIETFDPINEELIDISGTITTFISNRVQDISAAAEYPAQYLDDNELLWIDQYETQPGTDTWAVVRYVVDSSESSWVVHRQPVIPADLSKFRGCFVYDTGLNTLLARLDVIDPIAGKISGLAEEELKYKTYYDPATYNVGNDYSKDEFNSWSQAQVGELWWDLSTVKYVNYYQGSIIHSQSVWNTLAKGASIDIYEWVESRVLPSEWDELSGTSLGSRRGISGTSKYGDLQYVVKQQYDKVSQSFSEKYYFWVNQKATVPAIEGRRRSALDVTNIIKDPKSQGLQFVAIMGNDRFSVYNCIRLARNSEVAINFRYWIIENQTSNIHSEYQILSEGLATSIPKKDIQEKWVDSLVGSDRTGLPVPDPQLSVKQKYGSLNRPRQSWFVNRVEALKQFVERVNRVLQGQLVADNKNISSLAAYDAAPVDVSQYDVTLDTVQELDQIGTVKIETAVVEPILVDGRVERVQVVAGGRGYRSAPNITISGTGEDLELRTTINYLGVVTSVDVINTGQGYDDTLTLTVRPLSALVLADSGINGNWAIYQYNTDNRQWARTESQKYNVADYWQYVDWYAPGFSDLTSIDFLVQDFYQLNIIDDNINNIVKVENAGASGWVMLQKVVNIDSPDYTINYRVVGRQAGTIQLLPTLYTHLNNTRELRVILETIRNNLFIDDLAIEYNNLFFASLRYVFSEQNYVDWAFKTSFVKAKHNVSELEQRTTFRNDNLPSYEQYINEVKPYKTTIREYLSSYKKQENTQSVIIDFDLPAFYNKNSGLIETADFTTHEDKIVNNRPGELEYPALHWQQNVACQVASVHVTNSGSGYTQVPQVLVSGGGGSGVVATARVSGGKVVGIEVISAGDGFVVTPQVTILGSQQLGGVPATASAVLENKKVRSIKVSQKFDRVTAQLDINNLATVEEFESTGNNLTFLLKWPMSLARDDVNVFFNGVDALLTEFSYSNQQQHDKSYTRYKGVLELEQPQPAGTVIKVEYVKSYNLLTAADRVNILYDPQTGQYGKQLAQLMDGVDYGGVEVKGLDFNTDQGWDTHPWGASRWDTYSENLDEEVFVTDGSTTIFKLAKPLETDEEYNVYVNGVRVDDPNYDGSSRTYVSEDGSTVLALGNPNAIMKTLTSASVNYYSQVTELGEVEYFINIENVVEFEQYYIDAIANAPVDQTIVIRKSTSDGSFLPDGAGFDTLIEGGNLIYGTATGLAPEDITVDGDGFVTATTSKGPEELIPGQLFDTLDLKVYDRDSGASLITVRHYDVTDTHNQDFALELIPQSADSLIVKVNGEITSIEEYTVNLTLQTVSFNQPLTTGQRVSILSMSGNGNNILDISNFIADGAAVEYITRVTYQEGITAYAAVDGIVAKVELFSAGKEYGSQQGLVGLRFVLPPEDSSYIYYALYKGSAQSFSEISTEQFEADGVTSVLNLESAPFVKQPVSHNVLVKVNNKLLMPGYTESYVVTDSREYPLDASQFATASLDPDAISVYLNDIQLIFLQDYSWDTSNSQVVLNSNVGNIDDKLDTYVRDSGEYQFLRNTQLSLTATVGEFIDGETVQLGSTDSTFITSTVVSYSKNLLVVKGVNSELTDILDRDDTVEVLGLTSGARSGRVIGSVLIEVNTELLLTSVPQQGDVIEVYKFSNHDVQDIQMITKTVSTQTQLLPGTADYYEYNQLTNGLIRLREPAVNEWYVWVAVNGELLTPALDYAVSKMNNYVDIARELVRGDKIHVVHFAAEKITKKFGYRMFKDMLNRTHYKRLNKDKTYTLAQPLRPFDASLELTNAAGITLPSKQYNIPGVLFINAERIEYFTVDGNTVSQLRRGTLGTGVRHEYTAGTEIMDQSTSESIPYTDEMITSVKLEDDSTRILLDWMPVYGETDPAYKGEFVKQQSYAAGDVVLYNGYYYRSITGKSSGSEFASANWQYESPNEFEVFVGGRRLRKSWLYKYESTIAQDSPEGDVLLEPEFILENGNQLVLATAPINNSRVIIVRKLGKLWQQPGETLQDATSLAAEFIRQATTDLPKS